MKKICILGASGMLGSEVLNVFLKDKTFELIATARNDNFFNSSTPKAKWKIFDVEADNIKENLQEIVKDCDYVINCIGIIKPYAKDDNPEHIKRAIKVNSLFPYTLSDLSKEYGFKVLQIATDCVYSGQKGLYNENDKHDALDVYGKTKSLGEVIGNPNFYNLRCSIIGKEQKAFTSLLEWFLRQPKNATVDGYANHYWNGITTHHFSKICLGIIKNNVTIEEKQHIIPADIFSKYDMLKMFAEIFKREDIKINKVDTPVKIDRTISTVNKDKNIELWKNAGYSKIPSIEFMIKEIGEL